MSAFRVTAERIGSNDVHAREEHIKVVNDYLLLRYKIELVSQRYPARPVLRNLDTWKERVSSLAGSRSRTPRLRLKLLMNGKGWPGINGEWRQDGIDLAQEVCRSPAAV